MGIADFCIKISVVSSNFFFFVKLEVQTRDGRGFVTENNVMRLELI